MLKCVLVCPGVSGGIFGEGFVLSLEAVFDDALGDPTNLNESPPLGASASFLLAKPHVVAEHREVISGRTLKVIFKWCGIALALAIGSMLLLIGIVEIQTSRSRQQVERIVRELAPGSSYQMAVDRLGAPMYAIVDQDEMARFNKFNGPAGGRAVAGEKLHVFFHRGTPWRFVLVFTDAESLIIRQASWESM